ncbi:MAG TPA: FecR domain-containing protein [Polyangiaceae bacterium]|jgi:transmembrane sensor
MTDLDARLARGPLRVQSLWSAGASAGLARRVLRRRRFLFALDAAALCACLALVIVVVHRGALRVPSSLGGVTAAAVAAGGVTAFMDGSVAEASSRDTELRVEEDTPTHVVTRVVGGARFNVVPNHERTFEVRAGDVRVRVLGTIFAVQQVSPAQTQVLVERGRVEVAWLGGATLLESGQGGIFPPASGADAEPEPPPTAPPAAPSTAGAGPSRGAVHSPGARGWREAARMGDYDRAYEELSAKADGVRDEPGDLMLAADVARLSAHPEEAVRPLRSVCERHASDRRAPVAAFTLGRVLEDDLGRSAEAAAAFQKARTLWPAGPLAEDALAREAAAWDRAGRAERRGAAEEYLARYPRGRHAAAMRKILAR